MLNPPPAFRFQYRVINAIGRTLRSRGADFGQTEAGLARRFAVSSERLGTYAP